MAEYFRARNIPVPVELQRGPLGDWRRWFWVLLTLVVVGVGLQIAQIDISRANPEYAGNIVFNQLFRPDWTVLFSHNEFETFWDTGLGLMVVTIFLAIVATAISVVLAVPLSFLGARNIMAGHPVTFAIYAVMRVFFTIVRSIDILIVGIIAVVLFSIGNAAGVFAIAFHNIGVLGKLYSEAIEGIDAGPIEAITTTGANRVQVVWSAVLPQIVTPFIALTVYRLDANVRFAPIIGIVGAGGIGVPLFQNMQLLRSPQAGAYIFMIVATVVAMDFISAQVRRRLL
jgi:phosphonate transport system permease protein